jgi:hypothetical protein
MKKQNLKNVTTKSFYCLIFNKAVKRKLELNLQVWHTNDFQMQKLKVIVYFSNPSG